MNATLSTWNPSPSESYIRAARDAGCPPDQIRNYLRAGLVLSPKQLRFGALARECDRPCDHPPDAACHGGCAPGWVGYGGARGGGKSHVALGQVACDDCQRFPGLKFLYLRKVGKAGREAIQDLRRAVLHSTPHEYRSQEGKLIFPNGSRIVLGHFQTDKDIDNYLGLEYDGAIIEEATQLSSRKVRDIATCVRTSKPGWRTRIYPTTNPGGIGHAWFRNQFIDPARKGTERETRFVQATVRDNPFVGPEYRAKLEALTGWQRRAWLFGDWDIAAGQFFTTFRRDHHVLPSSKLPAIASDWRVWIGLDYGFTHYTAAYLFAQNNQGVVYVYDEHAAMRWLVERHAKSLDALAVRHALGKERIKGTYAGTDCFARKQNGGTIADDYKSHGWKLLPANVDRINGAAEILRRLGDPDAGIEPTLFIAERCARLAECIPALEHDENRPEDVLKVDTDEDGIGGDDFYDAMRYGIMAAANRRVVRVF